MATKLRFPEGRDPGFRRVLVTGALGKVGVRVIEVGQLPSLLGCPPSMSLPPSMPLPHR